VSACPSPHELHVDAKPEQNQLDSIWQVEEHPSEFNMFPSSQISV